MDGLTAMKARGRSKVTNGSRLLPDVDGRTVRARRMRDLIQAHTADLGGDGEISEAEPVVDPPSRDHRHRDGAAGGSIRSGRRRRS